MQSRSFMIYISIIAAIVVNNCTLAFYVVTRTDLSVRIFTYAALLPSIVYLAETLAYRDGLVEVVREIKDIKRALLARRLKHVAFATLLSTRDSIKIILAFMIFIFQMVIVFIKCLSQEVINFDT